MSFYLETIIIHNQAPFESLQLDFSKEGINVLTGLNGRGKTTIISFVVDALIEISKKVYQNEYKDRENTFYRVSSDIFSMDRNKPSLVYIRFKKGDENIDYVNIRGILGREEYSNLVRVEKPILFSKFNSSLKEFKYIKFTTDISSEKTKGIFDNFITPYFPSYRFEIPGYLTDVYSKNVEFKHKQNYSGYLPNKIEVVQSLDEITNWIMDVVLDWMVTRQKEEENIWENLNKILTELFKEKSNNQQLHFGIGTRNIAVQRLSILSNGKLFAPNMQVISAGEASIIGMFAEIIRQADNIKRNIPLEDIEGIVLIDEIDKHLHIKFQNEVLPKLMNLFPKLQFVISSHSPFLNMGLAEFSSKDTKVFDLDNNGLATEPRKTVEFENFYNSIIADNTNYAHLYESLKEKIESLQKPLIITEGKTDVKHLKNAFNKLELNPLDAEFVDVGDLGHGDITLLNQLKSFAIIKRTNKVIGIFDRDNETVLKELNSKNESYKSFGNNVYAFAIPLVNEAEYGSKISIEHCYCKKDLLKEDKNGRRLFLGEEFFESGISKDGKYQTKIKEIQNKIKINGVIDDKVYSRDDLEMKTNIALTKNYFSDLISDDEYSKDFDFSNFKKIYDIIKEIIEL